MPRTVDHAARRSEIARAVWTLVARGGMEAVSLRSVATEAGVSMGRVQYYFASKDALLLHGLEQANHRLETRITGRITAAGSGDRDTLLAILDELLGAHPETRQAIRVHVLFAARSTGNQRLAAVLTDGDQEILALAVAVIAEAQRAGRVGPEIDPEQDGYALWTFARGLGIDVALYGASVPLARRALERFICRVAPPA